jgi:hypothetical protein
MTRRTPGAFRTLSRSLALALACGHAASAWAGPVPIPFRVVEQAIETSADAVVPPSSTPGTLVVTPCASCPPRSFVTTATTRYASGVQVLDLRAFRDLLSRAPGRGLTLFFDPRSGELTRVIVSPR